LKTKLKLPENNDVVSSESFKGEIIVLVLLIVIVSFPEKYKTKASIITAAKYKVPK